MLALQGDMERADACLALKSPVRAMSPCRGGGCVVQVDAADGPFEIQARRVVNAAGLHACAVAARIDGLGSQHVPVARFAKGSYFTLTGRAPFSHLIYPAPVDAWLGVHVTIDLGGQVKFGPDLEWLETGDPSGIDYAVDVGRAAAFEEAIRRYWPALPDGALQAAYSGVRPKIHGPGQAAPDFCISGPAQHGLVGLVNLFGIESPGLTSSLAIGETVADLLIQ
jgi:L-2-hydroxyglutarate oxidase LhgO